MKTLCPHLLFVLLFACPCLAKDSFGLDEKTYIQTALTKAAANPETLNLRAALINSSTPESEKPVITMKLNAIFAAAKAEGKMEYEKAKQAKVEAILEQENRLREAEALGKALRKNP